MPTFTEYYQVLTALTDWLSLPLNRLSTSLNFSLTTAFILGVIGAISPCQLSTNFSAAAFISQRFQEKWGAVRAAMGYFLGKALVYTVIGAVAIVLGLEASQLPTGVAATLRKLLGPMLVLMGVLYLGWWKSNILLGWGLRRRLEGTAKRGMRWGSFWLGVAFSFAFCPTLFLLFFGFLVPLSTSSRAGLFFPGLFAFGTTLPLHLLAIAIALGWGSLAAITQGMRRADTWVRRGIGIVFLLAGANEIVLYWVLG